MEICGKGRGEIPFFSGGRCLLERTADHCWRFPSSWHFHLLPACESSSKTALTWADPLPSSAAQTGGGEAFFAQCPQWPLTKKQSPWAQWPLDSSHTWWDNPWFWAITEVTVFHWLLFKDVFRPLKGMQSPAWFAEGLWAEVVASSPASMDFVLCAPVLPCTAMPCGDQPLLCKNCCCSALLCLQRLSWGKTIFFFKKKKIWGEKKSWDTTAPTWTLLNFQSS